MDPMAMSTLVQKKGQQTKKQMQISRHLETSCMGFSCFFCHQLSNHKNQPKPIFFDLKNREVFPLGQTLKGMADFSCFSLPFCSIGTFRTPNKNRGSLLLQGVF